jgi:hypothetical protein
MADKGRMLMHFARFDKSDRLQRVYHLLLEGPQTTMDIIQKAGVCAVSSIISELRAQGIRVECEPIKRGVYKYQLESQC